MKQNETRREGRRLAAKQEGKVYHAGAKRITVGELLETLRNHHETEGTKSRPRFEQCSCHLRDHFGADAKAMDITHSKLKGYVKARRRDPKRPAKPATIRLELSVLAQAFKIARQEEKLASARLFPTVRVENVRTAHFTDGELAALLDHFPPPVRAVVEFASLTGWRLQEVLSRQWSAVDFAAGTVRLEPGETKSGKGRVFPFGKTPRLAALLDRRRQERWRIERERGVEVAHVFHREGVQGCWAQRSAVSRPEALCRYAARSGRRGTVRGDATSRARD